MDRHAPRMDRHVEQIGPSRWLNGASRRSIGPHAASIGPSLRNPGSRMGERRQKWAIFAMRHHASSPHAVTHGNTHSALRTARIVQMTLLVWLRFIHILSAIVWLGG